MMRHLDQSIVVSMIRLNVLNLVPERLRQTRGKARVSKTYRITYADLMG